MGGGRGGGGLGHPQGAVHMVAARLGCKWAVVGTGWANSHPVCMNRLRKRNSHLVRGSFLAGCCAHGGCMNSEESLALGGKQPLSLVSFPAGQRSWRSRKLLCARARVK